MTDLLQFKYDFSDDVCFECEHIRNDVDDYTFRIGVEEDHEIINVLISTAEAKALLKFLKAKLEPKLENV